jgi:hypothetical protein
MNASAEGIVHTIRNRKFRNIRSWWNQGERGYLILESELTHLELLADGWIIEDDEGTEVQVTCPDCGEVLVAKMNVGHFCPGG